MPSSTNQRAVLPLELAKVAGLAFPPTAAALFGFAWFVRTVRDPLWVLMGMFGMALVVGVTTFLITAWCDRKIKDDADQSRFRDGSENESSLAK